MSSRLRRSIALVETWILLTRLGSVLAGFFGGPLFAVMARRGG
jgi:hypothetical protein